jgi:hypothetical protein
MGETMMPADARYASNGPVLDPSVLLEAIPGDPSLGFVLLDEGLRSLVDYLAQIDVNGDDWSAYSHKIKGLAAGLGAARLADAAAHAQAAPDHARRAAWLGIMRRELAFLEMHLRQH